MIVLEGKWVGGLGEKGEGIKPKKILIDTNNCRVVPEEKAGVGRREKRAKEG